MNKENLFWIDLEMTGLNPLTDLILEIGYIITDKNLEILYTSDSLAISQSEDIYTKMDDWNLKTHTKSGLLDRVKNSNISILDAQKLVLEKAREFIPEGISPVCGSSVYFDRMFMSRHMPILNSHFHYRIIDVSGIRELADRWYPSIQRFEGSKENAHTATNDILKSIDLLKYYKKNIFII